MFPRALCFRDIRHNTMDEQPSPGSSTEDKVVKKRGAPDFKKSIKRGSACLACRSKYDAAVGIDWDLRR